MRKETVRHTGRWWARFWIAPLFTLASCLLPFMAFGQDVQSVCDSLLRRDYRFVKRDDPWLTSHNAAALVRYQSASIAQAELVLSKEKGRLTDYSGSPDVVQLDAGVESFFRLSPQAVVFGRMGYDSFTGQDMAGSAFIDPANKPFDLVEDSLMNTGEKHRDTYRLCGGFGVDLGRGLSVGAKLDYTSANYAKYKDLRHQNKLMDLQFSAGIYLPFASWGAVGAHYLYHRNTESISFGTYGKTDKTYQTLVSYAAFMGHLEQFGSTGYTDKSREMPLVSDYNGFGLQLSLGRRDGFLVFADFGYAHRQGYYGRKSPYTITYARHESDVYQLTTRLQQSAEHTRHRADFALDIENLQNLGTTYRDLQGESGATYYEYYTSVKTANRLWATARFAYTLELGIERELPAWILEAGCNWMHRRQTAYVFPYYRRQDINSSEPFVALTHHLVGRHGVWQLSAHGSFLYGDGEPYEDGTFQTPSDKQAEPPTMEAWLYREYHYLTAAQYTVGGNVGYAFLFPGTSMRTHVGLSLRHRKANGRGLWGAGRDRTSLGLTLGCTF